jgi:hypothetical protein
MLLMSGVQASRITSEPKWFQLSPKQAQQGLSHGISAVWLSYHAAAQQQVSAVEAHGIPL